MACATSDILSREERSWLSEHQGSVVLAVETGYAPFVFLDSRGRATGLADDCILLAFTEPFITVPNVIIVRKDRSVRWRKEDLAGLN